MNMQITNPEVFIHRANLERQRFEFLNLDRKKISETTFLDDNTLARFSQFQTLSFDALFLALKKNKKQLPPASNFIFHTSFCCSTLITKALDCPGKVLSLREPNVLLNLCNYKRSPAFPHSRKYSLEDLLEAALRLMNKPFVGNETCLIKPSNISNNLIGDILNINSRAKAILLYQDQKSFLISILKKGEPGRVFCRKFFMTLSLDGDNRRSEY